MISVASVCWKQVILRKLRFNLHHTGRGSHKIIRMKSVFQKINETSRSEVLIICKYESQHHQMLFH